MNDYKFENLHNQMMAAAAADGNEDSGKNGQRQVDLFRLE
jgi:hypothetical protein